MWKCFLQFLALWMLRKLDLEFEDSLSNIARIYIHINLCVYMCVHVCVRVCTSVYVCVHVYIIYTCICTYN